MKINGKYYNWTTACPIIMTLAVFQRQLPQSAVGILYSQYMPILLHDDKKLEIETKPEGRSSYSSWFSWRRSTTQTPKKSQEINQGDFSIIKYSTLNISILKILKILQIILIIFSIFLIFVNIFNR